MDGLTKPRALSPGQTIGLVAPSSALPEPALLKEAVARLEGMGYRVRVGESCLSRHGYLAGEDALRAADLMGMFLDDAVDAILCVRGGYGAMRVLPLLDYPAIAAHPKVFSGYSDVTALHGALVRHAGLVTFHGLMAVSDFADGKVDAFSQQAFWRLVSNPAFCGPLENPVGTPRGMLRPGVAEGPLMGGNLSLVAASLGTPYAQPLDGALLLLEDVGERSYAVDRMLMHLKNAGVFDRVAGVLLGTFTDCEPAEGSRDFRVLEICGQLLADAGVPVMTGLQYGHCTPKLSWPYGIRCRMDAAAGTLTMLEPAISA